MDIVAIIFAIILIMGGGACAFYGITINNDVVAQFESASGNGQTDLGTVLIIIGALLLLGGGILLSSELSKNNNNKIIRGGIIMDISAIIFGIMLMIAGGASTIHGININNDVEAQFESVFNNGQTDPGTVFIIIGALLLLGGLILLFSGISKNKQN